MNEQDKNRLIWRSIYDASSVILPSEKESFIKSVSRMPEKGYGCILIEKGKVQQSKAILEKIVGEYEWEYYPEGFITDDFFDEHFYYGKFEVEHEQLVTFFNKLIKENIVVIECGFKTI